MGVADEPFGLGLGAGADGGYTFMVCLPGDGFGDFGGQAEDMAEGVDDEVVGSDVIVVDENGPRFFAGGVDGGVHFGMDVGLGAHRCARANCSQDASTVSAVLHRWDAFGLDTCDHRAESTTVGV